MIACTEKINPVVLGKNEPAENDDGVTEDTSRNDETGDSPVMGKTIVLDAGGQETVILNYDKTTGSVKTIIEFSVDAEWMEQYDWDVKVSDESAIAAQAGYDRQGKGFVVLTCLKAAAGSYELTLRMTEKGYNIEPNWSNELKWTINEHVKEWGKTVVISKEDVPYLGLYPNGFNTVELPFHLNAPLEDYDYRLESTDPDALDVRLQMADDNVNGKVLVTSKGTLSHNCKLSLQFTQKSEDVVAKWSNPVEWEMEPKRATTVELRDASKSDTLIWGGNSIYFNINANTEYVGKVDDSCKDYVSLNNDCTTADVERNMSKVCRDVIIHFFELDGTPIRTFRFVQSAVPEGTTFTDVDFDFDVTTL